MNSLESRHSASKDKLKPLVRRACIGSLVMSIAVPNAVAAPVSKSEQQFGIFDYGHRGAEIILQTGDIAKGFLPVNGVEYGEEDVKLFFNDLKKWKEANLDFAAISWLWEPHKWEHGKVDFRDKYLKFALSSLKRPDNPYKGFKLTIINESESNANPSREELKMQMIQLKAAFEDPDFLKDEDGRPLFFNFNQENEGIMDNLSFEDNWEFIQNEFNVSVVLRDYFGSNLKSNHNKFLWFNYGYPMWDLMPSGISDTGDVVTVYNGYKKKDDFKIIPRDGRFEDNYKKALKSKSKIVMNISDDEGFEYSQLEDVNIAVMKKLIPPNLQTEMVAKRADRMLLLDGIKIFNKNEK